MFAHLMSVYKILLVAIDDGPFGPKNNVNGVCVSKSPKDWNYKETSKPPMI